MPAGIKVTRACQRHSGEFSPLPVQLPPRHLLRVAVRSAALLIRLSRDACTIYLFAASFLQEFGDLTADDTVILKWTLRKYSVLWWSGLIWRQTETSDGPLRKCNVHAFPCSSTRNNLDQLSYYWLLNNNSAPQSHLTVFMARRSEY